MDTEKWPVPKARTPYLNVLRAFGTFHFAPERLHAWSPRGQLPAPADRLPANDDPLDDFAVVPAMDRSRPPLRHATLVMYGTSIADLDVEALEGPLFLVNWTSRVPRLDAMYVTGDEEVLDDFVANRQFPILYTDGLWVRPDGSLSPPAGLKTSAAVFDDARNRRVSVYHRSPTASPPPLGSGLAAIVALGWLAERVTVHGWDFFLSQSIEDLGYLAATRSLYDISHDKYASDHFESALYNFYYAHRFAASPRFRLHGHLVGTSAHPGLTRRLERVFRKPRAAGHRP